MNLPLLARTAAALGSAAFLLTAACAPAAAAPPVSPPSAAPPPPPPPAPPSAAPPPPPPPPDRHRGYDGHVDRLAFVLTSDDASIVGPAVSFDLDVAEDEQGEVRIGKNVPLGPLPSGTAGALRQDVGIKVKAMPREVGGELVVTFDLEMSAMEAGGTIRKVIVIGRTVGHFGKAGTVATIQDDKKHYKLAMTPTRLR